MTASGPSTCLPRWGARVADVAVKPIRQRMREALGLPPEEVAEEAYEPSAILVGGASEIIGPAKLAEVLRQPMRDGQHFYDLIEAAEAAVSVEELQRKLNPDSRVQRSFSSEGIIPEPLIERHEVPRAERSVKAAPVAKPTAAAEPPDQSIAAEAADRVLLTGGLLAGDLKELFAAAGVSQTDSQNLRLAARVLEGRAGELERVAGQLKVAPRSGVVGSREAVAAELARLQSGPDLASSRDRRRELAAQLRAMR